MITRLNTGFVSTAIIIDDLEQRAARGNKLAKQLVGQWEYPIELMFLKRDGTLVSKLNSYKDFPGIHPDVVAPPHGQHQRLKDKQAHKTVFLNILDLHFGKQ